MRFENLDNRDIIYVKRGNLKGYDDGIILVSKFPKRAQELAIYEEASKQEIKRLVM